MMLTLFYKYTSSNRIDKQASKSRSSVFYPLFSPPLFYLLNSTMKNGICSWSSSSSSSSLLFRYLWRGIFHRKKKFVETWHSLNYLRQNLSCYCCCCWPDVDDSIDNVEVWLHRMKNKFPSSFDVDLVPSLISSISKLNAHNIVTF